MLHLRKIKVSDLDNYFRLVGDAETMDYITGEPYNREETEQEIYRLIERFGKHPVYGVWVVEEPDGKGFVGVGGLIQVGDGLADLGYRVLRAYWGQGYGKAIAALLLKKAADNGLPELQAVVEEENIASIKILEGLGFEAVGERLSEEGRVVVEYRLSI